ncbi:hypothetical protein [Skermanella pratensis]|uniref:hypothetical protein n=1 Tax=Skermanella pratensis TaxID=2233999 RepID=UPI0031B61E6D
MALSSWTSAASVYLDRRVIAIMFLGFSSGLPLALTGATLSVWLVEGGSPRPRSACSRWSDCPTRSSSPGLP